MRRKNELDLIGPGALYHRVSTDAQDAERQRMSTAECLQHHNVVVPAERVYEDEGWARADAYRRPAFQRMLRDVENGHIQWILVDRPNRFGAKDKFEAMHYLHLLREAGCKLVTVDGRELTSDDTGAAVTALLDYDQSERELREKAMQVLEGKRLRAKRGEWQGGRIPYCLDAVCFRIGAKDDLVEQWRVQIRSHELKFRITPDGSVREYHGRRNFPATEDDEFLQLRPTLDEGQIDAVKLIFERFVTETIRPGTLARQLNDLQITPPPYAGRWEAWHVSEILKHPIYIGRFVWNRSSVSDYAEFVGGQRVDRKPGTAKRRHDKSDWILSDDQLFDPIIPVEQWEKAQVKLAKLKPETKRSKPEVYTYSGLLFCAHCNTPMHGQVMISGRKAKRKVLSYICGTYNKWRGAREKCRCKAYRVTQELIDQEVRRYLEDSGRELHALSVASGNGNGAAHKPPKDSHTVMFLWLESWRRMRERVQDRLDRNDPEMASLIDWNDPTPEQAKYVEGYFDMLRENDRPELEAELAKLTAEYDKRIEAWADLPTERAKDRAKERIEEIERRMDEIEAELRDVVAEFQRAADLVRRLLWAWEKALVQ